ncbi:hypothetical protein EJ04DRAFT_183348 [Polyplosphaeria fusca]|uniref:Uncharacterized protein n=1 Tax=Polyplosphaeria fusca TaxID=682080 RepID=A0A9P4UTV6_9PLEO|nr:hypothetical protein EJ04DRAFT_183348 [Polyplosphaeria fusca]
MSACIGKIMSTFMDESVQRTVQRSIRVHDERGKVGGPTFCPFFLLYLAQPFFLYTACAVLFFLLKFFCSC